MTGPWIFCANRNNPERRRAQGRGVAMRKAAIMWLAGHKQFLHGNVPRARHARGPRLPLPCRLLHRRPLLPRGRAERRGRHRRHDPAARRGRDPAAPGRQLWAGRPGRGRGGRRAAWRHGAAAGLCVQELRVRARAPEASTRHASVGVGGVCAHWERGANNQDQHQHQPAPTPI